jgi:hypothetical protein
MRLTGGPSLWLGVICWLLLQGAAIRPYGRMEGWGLWLPELALALSLLVSGVAMLWLVQAANWRRAVSWLDHRVLWWWLLVGLSLVCWLVYPIADGLKGSGRGSDADNALIDAATAMLASGAPYSVTTYLGNPLSPGPGWVMLTLPLSLGGGLPLLTPLSALMFGSAMRRQGATWGEVNLLLLALMSSLAWWEMAVVGLDLLSLGLLLAAAVALLARTHAQGGWMVVALLVGLLATGRVVFAYWPALVGLAVASRHWRGGLQVGAVGILVAIGLHLLFWWPDPAGYAPLHVFNKLKNFGDPLVFALLLLGACGMVGWLMLSQWRRYDMVVLVALGVTTPLLVVALGEACAGVPWALWNGASYLMLAAPLWLLALARSQRPLAVNPG